MDERGPLTVMRERAESAERQSAALQKERDEARELLTLRWVDQKKDGKTILDFYEVWLRQARDRAAALEAECRKWKEQAFRPLGDNRHNAALCPYCSPERAKLEAEVARLREALGALPPSIDAELSASPGLSGSYPHLYNMLHSWHEDACAALSPRAGPGAEGPKEESRG